MSHHMLCLQNVFKIKVTDKEVGKTDSMVILKTAKTIASIFFNVRKNIFNNDLIIFNNFSKTLGTLGKIYHIFH